jgi:alpha-tubulin suppressor-like RCC1 family protein
VVSWGSYGLLHIPVPAGLANVVAVATGDYHSVALLRNGHLVVWGLNNFGQCLVPQGIANVSAIAAQGNHTMVLINDAAPSERSSKNSPSSR